MAPTQILKPSRVMRLVKRGTLPDHIPGGRVLCQKCRRELGTTACPSGWENGSYCACSRCKAWTLARPAFPALNGQRAFEIDLSGERKRYPLCKLPHDRWNARAGRRQAHDTLASETRCSDARSRHEAD